MKLIQRDKIHPDRNPKSPILGKHTTSVQTRLESPKAPNHKNALAGPGSYGGNVTSILGYY